jgi:hypothetical protein
MTTKENPTTPPDDHLYNLSDDLPYVEYPPHAPDRWETTDGFCDEKMTNGRRATLVSRQVDYAALKHDTDYSDLIGGLLHLAHSDGHNPSDVYRSAIDNFHAEAAEMEGYQLEEP